MEIYKVVNYTVYYHYSSVYIAQQRLWSVVDSFLFSNKKH